MENINSHWTENSLSDYMYRIAADYLLQLESKRGSQKELARSLNITEGAVSQKLNNPGNLKLQTMIKYARAIGLKLSVVLYDDGDSENKRGPINADIFRLCWEKAGKPKDFWQAQSEWSEGSSKNHDAMLRIGESNVGFINQKTLQYIMNSTGENVTSGSRRTASNTIPTFDLVAGGR